MRERKTRSSDRLVSVCVCLEGEGHTWCTPGGGGGVGGVGGGVGGGAPLLTTTSGAGAFGPWNVTSTFALTIGSFPPPLDTHMPSPIMSPMALAPALMPWVMSWVWNSRVWGTSLPLVVAGCGGPLPWRTASTGTRRPRLPPPRHSHRSSGNLGMR